MTKLLIGIDIGTTSTKGILYSQNLTPLLVKKGAYPLYQTEAGMAEQDPEEIFSVVLTLLKELIAASRHHSGELSGVSFSSAMHSLIVMGAEGKALSRSITWLDNRSAPWAQALKESPEGQGIYERTGLPLHSMSPLSKLLWLQAEQESLFNGADKFIGIKEYIFFKLFDTYACDYSLGAATGLMNLTQFSWDPGILARLNIEVGQLPPLVPMETSFTQLKPEYQVELGLTAPLPFVIGGSDGCLASLGSGIAIGKEAVLTVGTSSALRMITSEPRLDPRGRTFCYPLTKDRWVVGGASNNGGAVFQWAKELVEGEVPLSYPAAVALASASSVGAEGLTWLPYLGGERAPLWSEASQGSILGLSFRHQAGDILRSALEGVFFNLAEILSLVSELNGEPTAIVASGGLLQAPFNQHLAANILAKPLIIPASVESSCLGAVMLGFEALGITHDPLPVDAEATRIMPTESSHYDDSRQRFKHYNQVLNGYDT